ncbi:MAG: glutamate 5-kinase [Oscillospiraceae bacterium]|jgi:glutamate 5-kinase|nr:glutamate 5-kinase [Oscillospiraceae bacterium]
MQTIKDAKRIVFKVGTSTLTHPTMKPNLRRMQQLAAVLTDLHNAGREVILVSSGAIAVGCSKLGVPRPKTTQGKQAVSSVGQLELMFLYDRVFGDYGATVAQLLLTGDDVDIKERRTNLMNCLTKLLEMDAIPIINENDSVSIEEVEFGDNDGLSAIVAKLVGADALVILTDTDGLYTGNPAEDENAVLIPYVKKLTDEIMSLGGGSGTKRGTGGMKTKLDAAKRATDAGIDTVILNGSYPENIYQVMEGRSLGTFICGQPCADIKPHN